MTRERLPLPEHFGVVRSKGKMYHTYSIKDMHAYSDAENAALIAQLANLQAAGIHSCHTDCTRSGCVNARLAEQVRVLREALELATLAWASPILWMCYATSALEKTK